MAAPRNEHDDDLTSTVDTHDDVETDDFPKTSEDFEREEPEQDGTERDDRDDEGVVGK